jgi:hypothetical protein
VKEPNYNLMAITATLAEMIPELVVEARSTHPLVASALRSNGDVGQIIVGVDVNTGVPIVATYDVPVVGLAAQMPLDLLLGSADRRIEFACDLLRTIARQYDRDLHSRVANSTLGFYGLRAALPQIVGTNTFGSIDESLVAGWRSRVVSGTKGVFQALISLERRCTRSGKSPDLTILDSHSYLEVVSRFQPQQRFYRMTSTGRPLLAFNGGSLYREPYADKGSIYTLHTSDFVFHDSPVEVYFDITIDGQLRAHMRQREQLFPIRRFRSGTVMMGGAREEEA